MKGKKEEHNLIYLKQDPEMETGFENVHLQVSVHEITFNLKKCKMIVGHNITKVIENLQLEKNISTVNLMSSHLSHEMITPLRCVKKLNKKVNEINSQNAESDHYNKVID